MKVFCEYFNVFYNKSICPEYTYLEMEFYLYLFYVRQIPFMSAMEC